MENGSTRYQRARLNIKKTFPQLACDLFILYTCRSMRTYNAALKARNFLVLIFKLTQQQDDYTL